MGRGSAGGPMVVLTYDIGGTRMKAALVTDGHPSSLTVVPTVDEGAADAVLDQLVSLGRTVTAGRGVDAVGVSVRGLVDPRSGTLIDLNPPLTCLIGRPLAAVLGAAFEAPVAVENDGRMYALGELRHGAGRGVEDVVCLTLGTGIGVGVAIDGRILRGARGVRGILGGHFTVDVGGTRCGCGNVGCLETLIGSDALVGYAREQLRADAPSALGDDRLDPAAIFAAAAEGDAVAVRTRDRFAAVLGAGVVTLIHAYDPDLVILGGGVSRSAAEFLPAVREHVRAHAWTQPQGRVRLEVSERGDLAALLGAFELATDDSWAW